MFLLPEDKKYRRHIATMKTGDLLKEYIQNKIEQRIQASSEHIDKFDIHEDYFISVINSRMEMIDNRFIAALENDEESYLKDKRGERG